MGKAKVTPKYQQYLGIVRDHSVSMSHLAHAAAKDYNTIIEALKGAAESNGVNSNVCVVRCGVGHSGTFNFENLNTPLKEIQPVVNYQTDGGWTPLFDSVNSAIDQVSMNADSDSMPDASFLVMAITDGVDNKSAMTASGLANRIQSLQTTDKWTFVFRVPMGSKRRLVNLGIPEGNILEWVQTVQGLEESSVKTVAAVRTYMDEQSRGITSTRSFYANLDDVKPAEVRKEMTNITAKVKFFKVGKPKLVIGVSTGSYPTYSVRDFMERRTRRPYQPGSAFYQLTKSEIVQEYKQIAIRNKKSLAVYVGSEARELLGIPTVGSIRLKPGKTKEFTIFIQSTSYNRVLVTGTEAMYYKGATYQPRLRFKKAVAAA
jgi:hypothetical protein